MEAAHDYFNGLRTEGVVCHIGGGLKSPFIHIFNFTFLNEIDMAFIDRALLMALIVTKILLISGLPRIS